MSSRFVCDVCNKPTEEVMTEFDHFTNERIFVARCHGKIDRCRIPQDLLENLDDIVDIRVFRSEKILMLIDKD